MKTMRIATFIVLFLTALNTVASIDFDGLVGYTVIAATHITGEFEGADYDKLVKLDNGMIFEWMTYHYHYAYHPAVVVFGKNVTLNGKTATVYKIWIEDDEALDAIRVR